MSKDPAFLFYVSDFITGTMLMSNEQCGIYIRLLCVQHQHGGLIDKASFNSMVKDNDIIRGKFIETEEGFYNERMMKEIIKRTKKSCNLSANAKKRWEISCKSNAIALQGQMPIKDITNNSISSIGSIVKYKYYIPSIEEVKAYCLERKNGVDWNKWHNFYSAKDWMIGKNKMKDWKAAVRTWEKSSEENKGVKWNDLH